MEARERRGASALARSMALMCVRQSMLEDLHRGLSPVTKTGDYSDVLVIDADGERLPWPDVSRFDQDEMRGLMRQIVNKIYTFLVKMDDPDFEAWRAFLRPQTGKWDKPGIDRTLMHFVEEYARVRRMPG